MASELLKFTSLAPYYENPPSRISYSYCAKLMPTGPLTVMADSNILSNVEKSLVESVVEISTTDVDENTKSIPIAASSGMLINDKTLAHQNDNETSIGTSSVGGISSGTVGADSDAIVGSSFPPSFICMSPWPEIDDSLLAGSHEWDWLCRFRFEGRYGVNRRAWFSTRECFPYKGGWFQASG